MDPRGTGPPAFIADDERPRSPAGVLSVSYRQRLIERIISAQYRWYSEVSQRKRNWNPDTGFDWRNLRHDLSDDVIVAIQGFFAVEQYVPDFVGEVVGLVRKSHGRSHFQLRWGSEEEKHSDTWENAWRFSRRHTAEFIDEYKYQLKEKVWRPPWGDPLHLLVYTVFQERATQLNYLNLLKIAEGKSEKPQHKDDADLVLAEVAQTIATDEAAHYNFFLELLRVHLYYFPQEALEAIRDVLAHFIMPAADLIPNWDEFSDTVYRSGIYGPREYRRDVVQVVFDLLGIESRKALEKGIQEGRRVPTPDGSEMRLTTLWDTFNYEGVEGSVIRLNKKLITYETSYGYNEVDPFEFVPNPIWPTRQ